MRILEIILVVLLAVRLLMGIKGAGRWLDWLSIGSLGVLGLHLWLEGYRWQMIPVYATVAGLTLLAIVHLVRKKNFKKQINKRIWLKTIVSLILLGGITLPPLLLPVPKIQKPDGPYPVGTISVMLVDESREELYSGTPGEPRRLMVQFWYPAEIDRAPDYAPWVENPEVIAPAISEFLGFPSFFLDHLAYAHSNSFPGVNISQVEGGFPVLLFSHGWNGFRAQNTFQMEALASHGYVVAAPDHTYGAVATVFPDGKVVFINRDALPTGRGLPEEAFMAAAYKLGAQWAGDLSFILDSLETAKPEGALGLFANHLDFTRVGALGHSTGGGAAIQFCVQDTRCQAVLGMDPYMDPVAPEVLAKGSEAPVMGMFSEARSFRSGDNLDQFDQLRENSSGEVYRFEIEGTAHYDFSDLPAFSPLAHALGLKGAIRGQRALEIISDYTLGFFGFYFEGVASDLLKGDLGAYPEVIWR